jgi:hypothetical protein
MPMANIRASREQECGTRCMVAAFVSAPVSLAPRWWSECLTRSRMRRSHESPLQGLVSRRS